jgi:hypothetical protein
VKIAQIFKEGLKFGGEELSGRGTESKTGQDNYELHLHQLSTLEDDVFPQWRKWLHCILGV